MSTKACGRAVGLKGEQEQGATEAKASFPQARQRAPAQLHVHGLGNVIARFRLLV